MMHGRDHARQDLDGFNEVFFLLQRRRKFLVDGEVGKLALGGYGERVGHLEYEIGWASARMRPAVLEVGQLGRQWRLTFGGSTISPGGDGLDLLRRQTPIIAELAKPPIRTPRRHLSPDPLVFDGA